MCLETVDKKIKKGRGYGYKDFLTIGDDLGPLTTHGKGSRFPEGVWITDTNEGKVGGRYPKGFHLFTSKRSKNMLITQARRKVYYEDVVASGKDSGNNVIVARKMYIMKGKV